MGSNAKQFVEKLRKQGKEIPAAAFQAWAHDIAYRIFRNTVLATPVDTGRARNGWYATIDVAGGEDRSSAGRSAQGTLTAAQQVIAQWKLGQTFVIQNNVPYIRVLEFGLFDPRDPGPSKDRRKGRFGRVLVSGGFSIQAPEGMLGDAVQEARTFYGLA